jgi:hypothetical protein
MWGVLQSRGRRGLGHVWNTKDAKRAEDANAKWAEDANAKAWSTKDTKWAEDANAKAWSTKDTKWAEDANAKGREGSRRVAKGFTV